MQVKIYSFLYLFIYYIVYEKEKKSIFKIKKFINNWKLSKKRWVTDLLCRKGLHSSTCHEKKLRTEWFKLLMPVLLKYDNTLQIFNTRKIDMIKFNFKFVRNLIKEYLYTYTIILSKNFEIFRLHS